MACKCRICKLLRRLKPLMKKATADERRAMDELLLCWEDASNEACYWEMKAKGTWPEMLR